MENVTTHSKAKLALAVFTSPAAAFEEITRRRLLGTALAIVALTGTISMIPPIIAALGGQRLQWLVLGQYNPVAWMGLCLLYTFAMQKLLKWLGSQVDYAELLTLVGWSQLSLLAVALFTVALSYGTTTTSSTALQIGLAGAAVCSLWYVMLMGTALHTLSNSPKARGILTYLVVHIAATIAFTITYSSTRMSIFQDALPGLNATAQMVTNADKLPAAGAAIIGLLIGALAIGKHLEWPAQRVKAAALAAGLAGAAVFGVYYQASSRANYYGRLLHAHNAYADAQYSVAAKDMDDLLAASKPNVPLMLDDSDMHYLAGDDQEALDRLDEIEQDAKRQSNYPNDLNAMVRNRRGIIYDAQGKYPEALGQFEKASKKWPEFREPWVRMAVTYDRMGKYGMAIEAANHALKKLDAEATVAWVALAEAFAQTGDKTQEKAAIGMVVGRDKKLAARIDASPDGWRNAVNELSRVDLKSPLEKELAPQPKQGGEAQKGQKPGKR